MIDQSRTEKIFISMSTAAKQRYDKQYGDKTEVDQEKRKQKRNQRIKKAPN